MTQEALELARQLLWRYRHETPIGNQPHMICQAADEAFKRIDEALAQPEQEPVKIIQYNCTCGRTMKFESVHGVVAPQRTWVGLTNEEKSYLWEVSRAALPRYATYAILIEDKLKQKNGYAEENT